MAANTMTGNLALLIDGDNVSAKMIRGLMREVATLGTVSVRRIYGDFTTNLLKPWKEVLLQHSILPIQSYAYTYGKNSTDSAMIIDAMDLLYTGRFAGFVIVSSDSDFTRLAARIREQGVTVYGFGERHTNYAFIAACNKFLYFDVLNIGAAAEESGPAGPPQQQRQQQTAVTAGTAAGGKRSADTALDTPSVPMSLAPNLRTRNTSNTTTTTPPSNVNGAGSSLISRASLDASHEDGGGSNDGGAALAPRQQGRRPLDAAALSNLRAAINNGQEYSPHEDGWVNLAGLGHQLIKMSPDLNARNYGHERLWDFLEASGIVELKQKDMGDKPPIALVRLKEGRRMQ